MLFDAFTENDQNMFIRNFRTHFFGNISGEVRRHRNYENPTIADPLLLPQSLFEGSDKYLVHNAVYVVQENEPNNIVSIVSVGFDGKCFQKLRFTKELSSKDIDIKTYFDNPTYEPEIAGALYTFAGLVRILNEELYRISYYK